ncbi:bestrophin family protein [Chryseobacterium sp. BIGb0232]|uniref:bestrophin family protein n=1 Tax=Chryseobacterium sp. BIGb0232 TaxID=2940598 RepID=UPI000F46EDA3|nr:bestrophin family ion channel [Chryseobacterium sp. BIGb0232]MCS4304035.1 putative membrane protein [Chryseobacterium sp. BIGb0232]ROS17618.1 putative membrane protein [Chryseobacterium nakagawai]
MIIRKKEHWFKMLFVWHGSVLPGLLPRLFLLFILSLGVVYLRGVIFSFKIPLNPAPLTLFGFVLALFLGFKNNASYDRFWEGRKLWGALLNTARSLTRQALTLKNTKESKVSASEFIKLLGAFIFALKHQLRGTDAHEDLKDRLNEDQLKIVSSAKYKPAVIMRLLAEWVQQAKEEGSIDTIQQARFDENFDKLSDIVGGCERIVSTPLPYSYRVLLHRTVYIYCFLLPFGLVDSLRWFTPLIVVFVAYTFVAFEAIADEIEEPFGTEANDLALNSMSVMIEETIHEMAGEEITTSRKEKQTIID